MYIVNTETGDRVEVVIEPMQKKDYNAVAQSKRHPNFNWKLERRNTVFKLHTNQSEDILGLLSIEYFKKEQYIKINLIQTSKENVGKNKHYDRIAGCLIAYACRLSFIAGYGGCVALQPKTKIAQHYMKKYKFSLGGLHLFVELEEAEELIEDYLND